MITFLEKVKEKINEKIHPEQLQVIDNSSLHIKHKSFQPNKLHLKIVLKSEKLKSMSKVESHKIIYTALKDEMKNKIHALEIEIK